MPAKTDKSFQRMLREADKRMADLRRGHPLTGALHRMCPIFIR
jgi:hypothetical protein